MSGPETTPQFPGRLFPANLPADQASQRQWLAAYTMARHEKRIAEHLAQRNIDFFLPLYKSVHKWNNGCRKLVELPLFPSYIFVYLAFEERRKALQVPGLCYFVAFQGRPAVLPQPEIERLREALVNGLRMEPYPYLQIGRWVEICAGPLQGFRGIVLRKQGLTRVVISVDLIERSVSVHASPADLIPCPAPKRAACQPMRGFHPGTESAVVQREWKL